jgi:hypothetical protein
MIPVDNRIRLEAGFNWGASQEKNTIGKGINKNM